VSIKVFPLLELVVEVVGIVNDNAVVSIL